ASAVEGDAGAAVIALDHAVGVVGVYPGGVVVAVRLGDSNEGFAGVGGFPELEVKNPDGVGVLRVGKDVHIVPGAPPQIGVGVDPLPGRAPVIGAEEATSILLLLLIGVFALLALGLVFGFIGRGLDKDPDAPRLGRGSGDAKFPEQASPGQALVTADRSPGIAAVGGLPEAGVLAAADEGVGVALHLPDGGIEDIGVMGIHRKVHGASALALVEHLLPGLAAVAGAE